MPSSRALGPCLLLGIFACGSPTETSQPPSPTPAETPLRVLTPAAAVEHTDARQPTELLPFVAEGPVDSRRRALVGLGRVHDLAAVPGLVLGLRDPQPEVRAAAAFGIGALEREAPPAAVDALLGALVAEPHAASPEGGPPLVVRSTRATMLWSLARTADERVVPALIAALDDDSDSRVAVCRGLAYAGPSGWPAPLLAAAVSTATSDSSTRVREACWQGLGRVVLPDAVAIEARVGAVADLGATSASDDASIELRVQALRVLGRVPADDASRAALVRAAADPDWRVAVAALRALGAQAAGREGVLAGALDTALARWWPAPVAPAPDAPPAGGAVHVVITALEVAQPFARAAPIHDRATLWAARAERAPSSRDSAWIACRAAELVDLGRGWPSRVDGCGAGVLSDDDRRALAAEVLGQQTGAEPQRVAYLERLFREGGPRARQAVLGASTQLPLEHAVPLARLGLGDEDEGVMLAALELVRSLAPLARRRRDEAAMAASLEGRSATPTRFLAELDAPFLTAARRLLAGHSLEARVTLSSTAIALADPGAAPDQHEVIAALGPLVAHPAHGVRSEARRALEALGASVSDSVIEPVPDRQTLGELPRRARLETARGTVEIELYADASPTSVQRFAELARAGFFDTLTFHRVVPGFVVQGGDPRGDGYGGPDWWQRCEDSPLAYERGTVGMALAGRDTGGSQFFITLGPQHHLDGRYTVFGRVVSGLEHVEALQVGDAMGAVTLDP